MKTTLWKRAAAAVAAAGLMLTLSACGDKTQPVSAEEKSAVVLTVDGIDFTAEQYAAAYLYNQSRLDTMLAMYGQPTSADITDETERQTYGNNIGALAQQQLIYMAVCQEQMEQAGLTVEESALDQKMSDLEEQLGGAEQTDAYLSNMGLTREQYRELTRLDVMIAALREDYVANNPDAARQQFDENYLRCKHVLIKTVDDDNNELENQDELQAKAEDIAARAKAGEDFDALIAQYGEDPGTETSPDGYVFAEGEMVEEFYQGTKALDIGGISDPVKTSYGWHIIQRLPLRDEDFEAKRAAIEQDLFSAQTTAWQEAATVEEQDGLSAIGLDTAKSYVQ